jgi:hypothetical protein
MYGRDGLDLTLCATRSGGAKIIGARGTSMDRPIAGGMTIKSARPRGIGRSDVAMSVLQYGTAIVAIVAVTLLAFVR